MGLLDKKEITQEEKIHDLRTMITKLSNGMHRRISRQHRDLFTLIWDNPKGLTAQEVFDEYGADSVQFFLLSQNIQTMLIQVDPSYTLLVPPFPYTINPDGTVIVDYPIEDDPSSGDIS